MLTCNIRFEVVYEADGVPVVEDGDLLHWLVDVNVQNFAQQIKQVIWILVHEAHHLSSRVLERSENGEGATWEDKE